MQGQRNGWVYGLIGRQMNRWVEGRKERKKGGERGSEGEKGRKGGREG